MRIIAGSARSRKLVVPAGDAVRPTSDRVREAVMSALGPQRCDGAHVLDLFAGSGALGLEALSRGADVAVLVDHARDAGAAIVRNIEATGLAARLERRDVAAYLAGTVPTEAPFDLVFIDPPYVDAAFVIPAALTALREHHWCTPDATVVCEWPSEQPTIDVAGWGVQWSRQYGGTLVEFREQES
jgi:16S rRNA (guanine966-N2)-methyltransferase